LKAFGDRLLRNNASEGECARLLIVIKYLRKDNKSNVSYLFAGRLYRMGGAGSSLNSTPCVAIRFIASSTALSS